MNPVTIDNEPEVVYRCKVCKRTYTSKSVATLCQTSRVPSQDIEVGTRFTTVDGTFEVLDTGLRFQGGGHKRYYCVKLVEREVDRAPDWCRYKSWVPQKSLLQLIEEASNLMVSNDSFTVGQWSITITLRRSPSAKREGSYLTRIMIDLDHLNSDWKKKRLVMSYGQLSIKNRHYDLREGLDPLIRDKHEWESLWKGTHDLLKKLNAIEQKVGRPTIFLSEY